MVVRARALILRFAAAAAYRDAQLGCDILKARVPADLRRPLASLPRFGDPMGPIEILWRTNRRLKHSLGADLDADTHVLPTDAHVVKSVVTDNAISADEAGRTALL